MNNVLIIQARMGSSRLPGKVLKPLLGKPMLQWVVERASESRYVNRIVVATTTDPTDNPIEEWAQQNDVACFRGAPYDVLDRYYQAASRQQADTIIRVTADCPLIDPEVIDETFDLFEKEDADFAANRLPPPWHRTYPIGLDVEIVRMSGLEQAWKTAEEKFEREHVMPWFYDTPGRCKVAILDSPDDQGSHRWTVDTPEDYAMMENLFALLGNPAKDSWRTVLETIQQHPELEAINASSVAKDVKVIDNRIQ